MLQKTFVLLVILFTVVLSMNADTLTFTGYPVGLNDGHYYVGIASGTLNGVPISMWCIDSQTEVGPSPWEVNVVSLGAPNLLLDGLLPGVTLDDYRAMFLLGTGFNNTNPNDLDRQPAIWSFGNPAGYPLTTAQLTLKNAALAGVGNYDFSNAFVLEPVQPRYSQPFMTGVVSPVPEPTSALLLGASLVGLFVVSRRFRYSRQV